MSIIEEYYKSANIPSQLLADKVDKFNKNPDIKAEFERWIKTKKYEDKDAVCIEGYTAKGIATISKYVDGEAAFIILIELRENPSKAKQRLNRVFSIK